MKMLSEMQLPCEIRKKRARNHHWNVHANGTLFSICACHPCAGHLYSAAVWISHVTVFGSISTHARRSRNSDLELVTIPFLLALAFRRFDADLFVVLLQRCKILARLRELALLDAFANVVMDEGIEEGEFSPSSMPSPT